ncbi:MULTISPECIES: hypothetical protein [Butyricimonas]|jgi:hypothetical protein|uniref:Uncharacterized protein n=1 Tax=Butyricimonas faecihominis TaxID=1472416 RepID=A0A7W6HVJ7_9BACT|nr:MULTISPECIES: hypothetical protein [Butyricimonas]MBS6689090.1 hypothetical protein [Sanguibacteroides justesenii]KAB1508716.1 hypothetical protein F8R21_03810 [Butyricimonas faecihominis]MBB4025263.1 hypothetical protein [Butyricimonas faecihominis]WOF07022.1 hypothetical protein F1611_00690 [Butyricimonas faecihominis]BEI56982.1 hypothetical protein Bfae18676_19570 [Butyricimonas faecihominis]
MEKVLFHELYKRSRELEMGRCPSPALSGFLHGYLSVYSMVRVYPWLEEDFGEAYAIHERVREIARVIEPMAGNKNLPVDARAGYAVDLMDAYQLYSDLNFLNTALDAAYDILTPWGSDKIVLPCRTPNICRLLCNCYYLTGEEENGLLAGSLISEALGSIRDPGRQGLMAWWDAFCFYENVVGAMELPEVERKRLAEERIRLAVTVKRQEEEMITRFTRSTGENIELFAGVFRILARREFDTCNETIE